MSVCARPSPSSRVTPTEQRVVAFVAEASPTRRAGVIVAFADASGRGWVDELPVGEIELIAEVFGLFDGDRIHEQTHVEPTCV